MATMTRVQVKSTEAGGKPLASFVSPDDPPPERVVLETTIPRPPVVLQLLFCAMPRARAIAYSTERFPEIEQAVAQASLGIADETEHWYALRIRTTHRIRTNREGFTRALAETVEPFGWLNPVMMVEPAGRFLCDVALSDKKAATNAIGGLMKLWGVRRWQLVVNPDGMHTSL